MSSFITANAVFDNRACGWILQPRVRLNAKMAMGQRLKEERDLQGLTQQELAGRCDGAVSQTTIQSLEQRNSRSSQHAAAIAVALGVRVEWLLTGQEPKRSEPAVAVVPEHPNSTLRTETTDAASLKQFDVTASMGRGALVEDHPQVVQAITVSLAELKKQASFSSPPNLSFITGRGDSMLPTFNDGDMLLVDQNVAEHKIDAVFAFTYDGEFYVKTLQRVPGRGVMAVSHNRTVYEPFRIEPEKPFTIHGRVVLAWNARKL